MTEWRTIPGFTRYQVSNNGQVRSIGYRGRRSVVLKQHPNPSTGYLQVGVHDDQLGRQQTQRVNILVLFAFVGPRPDGMVCRHLNDIDSDNNLGNLAWGTPAQNMLDVVTNGNHHQVNKTHCPSGHPYDETNLYMAPSGIGGRQCRACHKGRKELRIALTTHCKKGHPYPPEIQARTVDRQKRRWCPTCIANRKPRHDRKISA